MIGRVLQKLRAPQETGAEPNLHHHARGQCLESLQVQRLEAACAKMETQGIPVSVKALARLSHVDKQVIRPFVCAYWARQGSEQEHLKSACATLEAEGAPVTLVNLCGRAHIGGKVAAAFLRDFQLSQPRPKTQRRAVKLKSTRPMKASPHERLAPAYARLQAQCEPIKRALLRRKAGASTDAARLFLRAQRTGLVPSVLQR